MQFQLTETNIEFRIIVPCRTKFNVLEVFGIAESELGSRVKALHDMLQTIVVRGTVKEAYK